MPGTQPLSVPCTSSLSALGRASRGTCHAARRLPQRGASVRCDAGEQAGTKTASKAQAGQGRQKQRQDRGVGGLGDVLGPIGLTIGGSVESKAAERADAPGDGDGKGGGGLKGLADAAGVSMGPISLTFSDDFGGREGGASSSGDGGEDVPSLQRPRSIASLTTEEWRARYEQDGCVDLWVEEEFNAGSRLVGGRAVHNGGVYGFRSGEGPSAGECAVHTVTIYDHYGDQELTVEVPEDRYILWEAEDQGLELPYACRMGCCTACAVKVLEGDVRQPQALGISEELKAAGYALMCVGYPSSDCVLQTVPEDEVYDLQFGRYFEALATDPNAPSVERDDFALEVANMDE